MHLKRSLIKFTTLVLVLCSMAAYPKGKAAKPKIIIHEIGQKNSDSWVFSTEIDQYQQATYVNPSLTYSSADNLDITVSSQNIPVWGGGAQNFQDDTYLMASKTFRLDDSRDIIIGGQYGYQLYDKGVGKPHELFYIDTIHKINDNLSLHGGSYYVNSALSTTTNYTGAITGLIFKYDSYIVRADYFGGHSNVSGATVSVGYFVKDWFNPYIGVGVPETNSGNEFYGIVGFTLSDKTLR